MLDFQHKLSTWLVKEYDVVAVEDLDVKPMLETSQSAKNKQNAAWSRFIRLLQYKGDLYGTHIVPVDPAGTTKECNQCGLETHKPIWIREHSCPAAGTPRIETSTPSPKRSRFGCQPDVVWRPRRMSSTEDSNNSFQ